MSSSTKISAPLLPSSLLGNHSKESVILAVTLCLVSTVLYLSKPSRAIVLSKNSSSSSHPRRATKQQITSPLMSPRPALIDVSEIFTKEELNALLVCWNEETPRGRFLNDRHGYTHFQFLKCEQEGQQGITTDDSSPRTSKGLIVVCHGLGVSYYAFDKFAKYMNNVGYSVLQYDYYGHGYSKYDGDMFVEYDKEMFVDQLEDLLEFVEKETGETCIGMVGHSTGGIVCAAANDRWNKDGNSRSIVPKLILASPAFFAEKPFMARVADQIPNILTSIMKNVPASRAIIGDSYMEAGEIAFAHDPASGKTIYAAEEKAKRDSDRVLFGKIKGKKKHPFLEGGILGINCHTLRGDLLEGHRKMLLDVLQHQGSDSDSCKKSTYILWIWGNLDKTVPFKENISLVQKWEEEYDNFHLVIQDRIGHEMFYEDSQAISRLVIDFLDA